MSNQDQANKIANTVRIIIFIIISICAFFLGMYQEQKYPTPVIQKGCGLPVGSLAAMLGRCPGGYKMNKDEYFIIFEDGSTKTVYSEEKDKIRAMSYQTGK